MFGYIKPFQPELRLREMTLYRAAYCGLCHTLSKRYGARTRLLVNYDFVLLVLLFWQGAGKTLKRRCVKHPLRGHCHLCESPAFDYAADALMLFTDWKLRDAAHDSRLAFLSRLMRLFYRKAFLRAAERLPDESAACAERMKELWRLERAGADASEAFGDMLACLSGFYGDGDDRKAARSLLFHLGRWIALADAADDLERDARRGAYNAIAASGLEREDAFALMGREQEQALAALDLLPENEMSEITRNILSLGLQARGHQVYTKERGAAVERPI
ncbi:MAG: DUF5685 family protein [Oscillospiraceae bacterium]|nr:DUF5685 family protein [Oscillospiraceae bacterium]